MIIRIVFGLFLIFLGAFCILMDGSIGKVIGAGAILVGIWNFFPSRRK